MNEPSPREIQIHMAKGGGFRTVHVDGAIGGLAPSGMFQLTLFSERNPIPTMVVHPIVRVQGAAEAGFTTIGPESLDRRVVRGGIYRELEVCTLMTVEVATRVRDLLTRHLAEFDKVKSSIKGAAK